MMNSVVRGIFGASVCWALAGCSGDDEPDWQYDQSDMEAAVFGTWTGTFTPDGGEPTAMTLAIRAHDESVRQLKCGSRTFTSGEATPGLGVRCMDSSSLLVSATLSNGDGSISEELDGSFNVDGTTLEWGDLSLGVPGSSHVWSSWHAGVWSNCELWLDEATNGTCTLDERLD